MGTAGNPRGSAALGASRRTGFGLWGRGARGAESGGQPSTRHSGGAASWVAPAWPRTWGVSASEFRLLGEAGVPALPPPRLPSFGQVLSRLRRVLDVAAVNQGLRFSAHCGAGHRGPRLGRNGAHSRARGPCPTTCSAPRRAALSDPAVGPLVPPFRDGESAQSGPGPAQGPAPSSGSGPSAAPSPVPGHSAGLPDRT